ncbi:MAG: serpin family protein [Tenuifilaceae bacterium]|nr:serpin family protein [Tenuifilaceae bacterium]
MKKRVLFVTLVVGVALFSCKKHNISPNLTPKEITLTAKSTQVITTSNAFGIDLFTKTAEKGSENLMLSPLSASTALTMLLNGCGGSTYTQLKATLNYPDDMTISEVNEAYKGLVSQLLSADPKVKIALANAIFYRNGFEVKTPFLSAMDKEFKAHIQGLDFSSPSALTTINGWASSNTFGKVPKVLNEISGDAVMFLMNALYFKGNWSYQFDKSLTHDSPFYFDNGTSANVKTMQGEVGARFAYGDNYKAIELPYGQTNFTMVVIVPDETLASFYNGFTNETWEFITSSLDGYPEFGTAEVYMPKFKFSYEKVLNDQLKSMGMVDAFEPSLADLSGISDASIYVSFVKQNTFVEVNEEGTEAAAVTTIGILETSLPQQMVFRVDKPFVFAIRERTTNTLMFIGQVIDPR